MLASAKNVCNSMSVVIRGAIGTLGTSFNKRWTSVERALWTMVNVPSYLLSTIVGLILSDGHLEYRGGHARLVFRQSMSHFPYFMFVWNFLAPLCQGIFRIYTRTVSGTVCYAVRFHTRCLPFLTERPGWARQHIMNL